MSRIRSIHPGIASDEAYMQMSMTAKAAWPILWTECDDHGVFEWKPVVLKARIFPADNVDFSVVLEEMVALNCVLRFEHEGKSYGVVRNFCAYQRPKHPSYRHPLPEGLSQYIGIKSSDSGNPPPALPQPSPIPTENPPQRKEEGGRMEKKEDAHASFARADDDQMVKLRRRVVAAYDPDIPPDTGYISVWLAQGYDPEICAGIVEANVQRGKRPRTLKYFDGQIKEAHATKAPPRVEVKPVDWDTFMGLFKRSQIWPSGLGPAPGFGGCRVPPDVLRQHGFTAAA